MHALLVAAIADIDLQRGQGLAVKTGKVGGGEAGQGRVHLGSCRSVQFAATACARVRAVMPAPVSTGFASDRMHPQACKFPEIAAMWRGPVWTDL
jgi:hypothetical protein